MSMQPNGDYGPSFPNDPDVIPKSTRVMQIIVGVLIQGVVMFLAIVLFIGEAENPQGGKPEILGIPTITFVATVMGASCLVASVVAPRLMVDGPLRRLAKSGASTTTKPGPKQVDPAIEAVRLLPLFQTQLIVGAALLEGGAFFAGIAYMLEHQYLALGVAGVLLAALIARFPTVDRVNGWLDEKLAHLEQIRRNEI